MAIGLQETDNRLRAGAKMRESRVRQKASILMADVKIVAEDKQPQEIRKVPEKFLAL